MTDKQKENKRAQNAEVLMWLAFICCGMMIAFVKKNQIVMMFSEQGTYSVVPSLIDGIGAVAALLLCFPPLYRRKLQNSVGPFIDVCKRSIAAFAMVALFKGVFII